MLDLIEIKNTVRELEQGDTTFDACIKLASLYTVLDKLDTPTEPDGIENELDDILPAYKIFRDVKRRYQLQEVTQDKVINQIVIVCNEIEEFINTLYSGTDMPEERHIIVGMLQKLHNKYAENP